MKQTKLFVVSALMFLSFSPATTNSSLPDTVEPSQTPPPALEAVGGISQTLSAGDLEEFELKQMLWRIGRSKGLPDGKIREIEITIGGNGSVSGFCANGESNWNPNAVGDGGLSHGLVQIYEPAHPDISPSQSVDPDFALNFIVDEFLAGREWKWTCWRQHFG